MKNFIKNLMQLIKCEDVKYKPYRTFLLDNGEFVHVNEEDCDSMKYFCDDEGIKYGNEFFSKIIIPKNILLEAIQKYK